ncbi:DNA-binding response regulator [Streptomyces hawaiiensis]|uniref:DNA-binding response regulator n=1 Tax=Streptomyces hawaiiensis TaxID=67305 RepID=UPI001FE28E31|nr:DNA-binding response regulator [Streptomyces hawaiiensis]
MTDIVTVRGDLDFVARTEHLFSSVREEFICAVRNLDTFTQPRRVRQASEAWLREPGGRQVRKLCGPAALADERDREHLRDIAARGARVRVAATALPHEAIIIDRRYAILAGPDTPGGREYTLTSGATLVGAVYALVEAVWESALDLEDFLDAERPRLDAVSRRVLRALGSGATDTAAAKELGMSLRTYRRRVAELLDTLDAGSRFQAGVRAGELGLSG